MLPPLVRLPYLLRERRRIFNAPREHHIGQFRQLLAAHSIAVRKVAEL